MSKLNKPLAESIRPSKMEDIIGQSHLLGENGFIKKMIDNNQLFNLILWGPPGCGKTTIAKSLANLSDINFVSMSAVFSGTADIKKIIELSKNDLKKTLLFIDEIHRFNKTQQDVLLPYIEDGTITFIGATTENPSFNLNNALISRCHICVLKPLTKQDLLVLETKILKDSNLKLSEELKLHIANISEGDARFLINIMEYLLTVNFQNEISIEDFDKLIQKHLPNSDKTGDEHYNLISAVHKSLRASDTDAALYWVARMIISGQDPNYIFRRLTRFAMEDIGLADPNALQISISAWQAYERLGSPEGDLALTELVIYLGTAPKSIGNYLAQKSAFKLAKEYQNLMPPKNILNAPTKMMKTLGYNEGYIYDPDTKNSFSGQNCFPEELSRVQLYKPMNRGFEREIQKRIDYWNRIRNQLNKN